MARSVFVTPATAETAIFGEVTVPLASFIQPMHRHYFSGLPERPNPSDPTTVPGATTSPGIP
jgi:hypothetical protein